MDIKDLNVIYFVTKLNKKMFDRLRAIKNNEESFFYPRIKFTLSK